MRRAISAHGKVRTFIFSLDLQEWVNNHPEALIACPHQPGNLKIMPAACAKRHQTANLPRWSGTGYTSFPMFVYKMNLAPCRTCAIGTRCLSKSRMKVPRLHLAPKQVGR